MTHELVTAFEIEGDDFGERFHGGRARVTDPKPPVVDDHSDRAVEPARVERHRNGAFAEARSYDGSVSDAADEEVSVSVHGDTLGEEVDARERKAVAREASARQPRLPGIPGVAGISRFPGVSRFPGIASRTRRTGWARWAR